MSHPTAVILVVGLNQSLLRHAPALSAFARRGTVQRLKPALPAVTCSVQSSMLTGLVPRDHGIVGNGWYNRELAEVQFWKQSNRLVSGEKVWETARRRDPAFTCANLFWWFNMYSGADYTVTPRPIYKADGRKLPDIYTSPSELRPALQERLGTFPLFNFWGPAASIVSSRWIAAAARMVYETHRPTLSLVYLPHLDYALQKHGPVLTSPARKQGGQENAETPKRRNAEIEQESGIRSQKSEVQNQKLKIGKAVREIDDVAGGLIRFYEERGVRVLVVSEYGIEAVEGAVPINRVLRENGALRVRAEEGLELLDAGVSEAFAAADHQIAHVYVRDPTRTGYFADLCRQLPGVEQVLDRADQAQVGLDHPRSGDLVLVADSRHWFSYPYWLDDACAPDFARTVDIHRKPGYDPLELFLDPRIPCPKLKIAWKLALRKLGFRTLLDVIPLDTSLVKGSHGRVEQSVEVQPLLISRQPSRQAGEDLLPCTAVREVILEHLFDDRLDQPRG